MSRATTSQQRLIDSCGESSKNQFGHCAGNTVPVELKPIGAVLREPRGDLPSSFSHSSESDASGAMPMARYRAMGWECAYTLLQDYPERLNTQEHVMCHVAVFSAPETARDPGPVLALYLRIAGART
jgi:hypothetical protein